MIDLLDNLLRQILVSGIGGGFSAAQIGFQPPNSDWRTAVNGVIVGGNPASSLNVYLFDLRENRKLRSNERVRTISNGFANDEPAPTRLDCHYLISAWSPAAVTPTIEPTLDEHSLLYAVARVLVRAREFNPSQVYAAGSAELNAWPVAFQNADLPMTIAPAEGFNKLAEFWSGMGTGSLWKPALYLIVTIPIDLAQMVSGPLVTTTMTSHLVTGTTGSEELLIQIGGHVFARPVPLAIGTANVMAINVGGNPRVLTVDNAAPFVVRDAVTANNARATIVSMAGNNLTLDVSLAGLAVGNVLRTANVLPTQIALRLTDTTGLTAGSTIVLRGEDAANLGTIVAEEAVIERIDTGTRFVTFRENPRRTKALNMNVAAANAPTLAAPKAGAWVRLERVTGERLQAANTNEAGRFTFVSLRSGQYQLRAGATGLGPVTRVVTVPSPTGEYNLQF